MLGKISVFIGGTINSLANRFDNLPTIPHNKDHSLSSDMALRDLARRANPEFAANSSGKSLITPPQDRRSTKELN